MPSKVTTKAKESIQSRLPRKYIPLRQKSADEKRSSKSAPFLSALFHAVCGFILGCARFPFGIYPCGTALVFAAGKNCFFSYIGASLACVTYPYGAAPAFAVNTIAFFARAFSSSYRFNEKKHRRLAFSSALSLLCALVAASVGGLEKQYVLAGVFYAVCLPAVTFAISSAFPKSLPKGGALSVNGSFCATAFIFVFALSFADLEFFSTAMFFSAVITLFSSIMGGSVHGLLLGIICGVACTGNTLSAALALPVGIAAFASGMCDKRKKAQCISCFFALFSVIGLLLFENGFEKYFFGALLGCVVFYPTSSLMPRIFENRSLLFPTAPFKNTKYEKISHAFSSISDVVYNVSDKLKYPTEYETRQEVQKTLLSVCTSCAMYEKCYSRRLYEKENVEDIICERLLSGGLKKSDLPDKYAESCIKLSTTVEKLNDGYAQMIRDRFRDNKTEILASEYSSMARLIKYTSQKEKADTTKDPILEEKARCALAAIGIRFSSVKAYGTRMKTVDVNGVVLDKFPCTSAELARYMSEKCDCFFGEPEYIACGDGMTMRMKRARKIKLEYARCACAKGGHGVNGDSVNFFESDEDFFYALISDGMGSGRSAALTSRLTSIFLEKLLTTGTHKTVTLEMLNNLLLSKNDESFATVDLLEIDLLSGDAAFIKAGAAPAYIVRASKLYKIASCTPPAGIVRSFCAESTKFSLEKGDTVLMLSDGIVQSSDDAPWLCEMLAQDTNDDPSRLCDRIISKAKKINLREDDMTCAAVRVV